MRSEDTGRDKDVGTWKRRCHFRPQHHRSLRVSTFLTPTRKGRLRPLFSFYGQSLSCVSLQSGGVDPGFRTLLDRPRAVPGNKCVKSVLQRKTKTSGRDRCIRVVPLCETFRPSVVVLSYRVRRGGGRPKSKTVKKISKDTRLLCITFYRPSEVLQIYSVNKVTITPAFPTFTVSKRDICPQVERAFRLWTRGTTKQRGTGRT